MEWKAGELTNPTGTAAEAQHRAEYSGDDGKNDESEEKKKNNPWHMDPGAYDGFSPKKKRHKDSYHDDTGPHYIMGNAAGPGDPAKKISGSRIMQTLFKMPDSKIKGSSAPIFGLRTTGGKDFLKGIFKVEGNLRFEFTGLDQKMYGDMHLNVGNSKLINLSGEYSDPLTKVNSGNIGAEKNAIEIISEGIHNFFNALANDWFHPPKKADD